MVKRTVLDNGIRVISEEMPGASATVGVWVENGSRHESLSENGISHFIEHLFFKGTDRRSARQISEEIEAVGGMLNAFTGKEETCYHAKVLAEHLPLAIDLLADIFLHSRLDPEEIDRERLVILQEISQMEDTPDEYVHELFNLHFWPDHPLSRPIHGTMETISNIQRSDFQRYLQERYGPDRMIIAAAGNLHHEKLVDESFHKFGHLRGATGQLNGVPPRIQPGVFCFEKPLEQVHLLLGTKGVSQAHPKRYAAALLNNALGGGMSSRLFQEIRERRGKAYSVHSFLSSYSDCGYLGIYVGTSLGWVEEVIDVILTELGKLKREGLEEAEIARLKSQWKGNMLLSLETSNSRMLRIAANEISFGREVSLEEVVEHIAAVTDDEIIELANQLFRQDSMILTILGNLKGERFRTDLLDAEEKGL